MGTLMLVLGQAIAIFEIGQVLGNFVNQRADTCAFTGDGLNDRWTPAARMRTRNERL